MVTSTSLPRPRRSATLPRLRPSAQRRMTRPLGAPSTIPSPARATVGLMDLRWIYLHMIEEYARHNGHADLLRELIDGVTGD